MVAARLDANRPACLPLPLPQLPPAPGHAASGPVLPLVGPPASAAAPLHPGAAAASAAVVPAALAPAGLAPLGQEPALREAFNFRTPEMPMLGLALFSPNTQVRPRAAGGSLPTRL